MTSLVIGCACASGCRPVALQSRPGELRVAAGQWSQDGSSNSLDAESEASLGGTGGSTAPDSGLQVDVSLELRDGHIEYRMRLRNPRSALVTAAYVSAEGTGERQESPIIVLFSDGRYRERFLELRGTGSVPASMRATSLAGALQERPGAFIVTLRGADFEEIWVGRLAQGR
jgi:hypothetical protein